MGLSIRIQLILTLPLLILGVGCSGGDVPFVPDSFNIPQGLETERFKLRMLTEDDAEADFEAVMESKRRLRTAFEGEWPSDDFTLQQNQADLAEHEKAFLDRLAFTFTVVKPDDSRILGCVYIFPDENADAQVLYWLRNSAIAEGMNPILRSSLEEWLKADWPFKDVNFVGVD